MQPHTAMNEPAPQTDSGPGVKRNPFQHPAVALEFSLATGIRPCLDMLCACNSCWPQALPNLRNLILP